MKVWLKREVGANPTLSRNCNSEQNTNATGKPGRLWGVLMRSQETCQFLVHTKYLRGNRWWIVTKKALCDNKRFYGNSTFSYCFCLNNFTMQPFSEKGNGFFSCYYSVFQSKIYWFSYRATESSMGWHKFVRASNHKLIDEREIKYDLY